MQVSVEKVSNIERRMTISVPSEKVEEAYKKLITRYSKTAKIDGFRPGKVPQAYITKHFGNDARRDALDEVMRKAVDEALVAEKMNPVSILNIEPKSMQAEKPFEFMVSFEVLPEIEKVNFTLEEIEKLTVAIKPEDIDRVITQLTKQYTKWKLSDQPVSDQSQVVIDYHVMENGVADMTKGQKNYTLQIGSKMMVPGFETGLIGAKAGDDITLTLTLPDDYHVAEKAGKAVDFVIHIKNVFEAEVPELNDAFIKQLGIQSGKLDDLKSQVTQSLTYEKDRLTSEKLKEQVFKNLLDQNPLDIPKSLIESEAKKIHDEMHTECNHEHSEQEKSSLNEIARKRIILSLLVSQLAKDSSLKPDPEKVKERIQLIAAPYENPAEVVEWLSSSEERLMGIKDQVVEEQVIDKLIENVKVTEKETTYAELKGIEA